MEQCLSRIFNRFEQIFARKATIAEQKISMTRAIRNNEAREILNKTDPCAYKEGTILKHPCGIYFYGNDEVGNITKETRRCYPSGADTFVRPLLDEKVAELLPLQARKEYATAIRNNTVQSTARQILENNQKLVNELNSQIPTAARNPFSLNADGQIIRDGQVVPDSKLKKYINAMRATSLLD